MTTATSRRLIIGLLVGGFICGICALLLGSITGSEPITYLGILLFGVTSFGLTTAAWERGKK